MITVISIALQKLFNNTPIFI